MIGASSIGLGGWLCFPVAAACTAGIVHVGPGVWARYMAVYGAPKCAPGVTCVIPPREWQPGGLFYHGGYPLGAIAPGFGFGGFGAGSPFGGASGIGGGGSGGGPERKRHHPHTPVQPVASPIDTVPDVGVPLVVSAPVSPTLIDLTPFAPPTLGSPIAFVPTAPAQVPEPASWSVFAMAVTGLAWVRNRRAVR